MDILLNKAPPAPYLHRSHHGGNQASDSLLIRLQQWFSAINPWRLASMPHGQLLLNDRRGASISKNEIMFVSDIPFVIPPRIDEIRRRARPDFERARLRILRMDEYLLSSEEKSRSRRRRHQDTSIGLRALAEVAFNMQKLAFREVLSVDETLPIIGRRFREENDNDDDDEHASVDRYFRQTKKIDPITEFHEEQDLLAFDRALTKHRVDIVDKPISRLSDMIYLKFCLMLEIQRDEHESCLRIILHDIIFKYHLAELHLRCELHVRKPIEREFVLERTIHQSHMQADYAMELVLWAGDWVAQQEVELYIVMKIESLSLNKFHHAKFCDMAHLHVKNVPHASTKIFLRELTPVSRPHRILSHHVHIGQVELEAAYWSTPRQISIRIIRVTHSQAERLLRAPETYVEIIFQGPFDIFDVKRTRTADRSLNPKFDEEFYFQIPHRIALSDLTVDLIFMEKSSLHHHHSVVHGVLTLSKHTDWYPVRKFWTDIEENPNIRLKDRFLFERNIYE